MVRPTKLCSSCRNVLPLAAFGVDRHRVDGLMHHCRSCRNQEVHIIRASLREKKNTYGPETICRAGAA
jgi:hypothetical protein